MGQLGCVAFSGPVRAEALAARSTDAEQPEPEARARAQALYEQGVKAYAEARYHEAADCFLDSNRIYPNPQMAFNVAKAYDKVGHDAGALSHYREYLRRVPDASDRAEVSLRIRDLEAALGRRGLQQLSILSEPEGATVSIDGRPVGITPWTGETWPGRHRIRLELDGYLTTSDIIKLDAHRSSEAEVSLTRSIDPQTAALARSQGDTRAEIRPLTWVALGTGVLALGTALAIEMASSDQTGLSGGAAFFTGAGVAGSALGGVMLYFDLNGLVR